MFDFLYGKPFGIQITDNLVHVMQLEGNTDRIKEVKFGEEALSSGTVVNGELLDPVALAENIKNALSKANNIKQKKCIFSYPESQCFKHVFNLDPNISNDEIDEKLDRMVADTLSMPFDDIKYSHCIYNLKNNKIAFVVAINKKTYSEYMESIVNLCGLKPICIEPESLSLLRNISREITVNHGYFLVYTNNNKIHWFLVWGGIIFDSNILSKNNIKDLLDDLEKSRNFFQSQMNGKVEQIVFIEDEFDIGSIIKMDIPIIKISNFTLNLKNLEPANPLDLATITGACLKNMGIHHNMPINLL